MSSKQNLSEPNPLRGDPAARGGIGRLDRRKSRDASWSIPSGRRSIRAPRTDLLESAADDADPEDPAPDDPGRRPAARPVGRRPALPQGDQRHRHHPAHRPGPRRAARQGPAADRSGAVRLLAAPGRHRHRRAIETRRADRKPLAATHRGRGGHGGQQQRRRHRRSCSTPSPAAARSSSRAGSWSRSAARSACPTSWRPAA